jgi:hypothetical protein
MTPDPPDAIISCGMLEDELEYLLRKHGNDTAPLYLDPALHVNFDKLKAALTRALEEAHQAGRQTKVIYGYCHPEMAEILEPYCATRIGAANCLEALLGAAEMARIEAGGKVIYLTAGWLREWKRMVAAGAEDLGLDSRNMFGDYRAVLVLDTGVSPIDEVEVEEFSAYANLPVERVDVSLDNLWERVRELL